MHVCGVNPMKVDRMSRVYDFVDEGLLFGREVSLGDGFEAVATHDDGGWSWDLGVSHAGEGE